jgi:hypothetical protein
MGTLSESVTIIGSATNLSPLPWLSPPPLGKGMVGRAGLPLTAVPLLGSLPSDREEGNVPVDPGRPAPVTVKGEVLEVEVARYEIARWLSAFDLPSAPPLSLGTG